jgi:hypothetical protein
MENTEENGEKIWKLWKKDKLNSEKIWKCEEKVVELWNDMANTEGRQVE